MMPETPLNATKGLLDATKTQSSSANLCVTPKMATHHRPLLPLVFLLPFVVGYNRPHCSLWPSDETWESFAHQLSADAALHGPFRSSWDYVKNCYLQDQERVVFIQQGDGLCMTQHKCINAGCRTTAAGSLELPRYTVEAHQVEDVQAALRFAQTHDLPVAVKSSGHSFEGQSTQADALLIWMRHFQQTNLIHTTTTCGQTHETFQVTGGQNFDDVFFQIKNNYHIAAGTCQTVTLGGGWLLGGGVSWTSRMYGYGVDSVVSMDVVLYDGTLVTANACNEHSDLFWAMRGGGGGNLGIVSQLEYILHPPTKIVVLEFDYVGGFKLFQNPDKEFANRWMDLLIRETPTLDRRWGGAWNPVGCRFMFTGSMEEAKSSTWMAQLDEFYNSVEDLDPNFGLPSTLLVEYDGFHDQNGGDESHENPAFDSSAATVPSWYQDSFSRVLPIELLQDKPIELRDLIVDMWIKEQVTHPQNYLFGGRTMDVGPFDTAIHPAMRKGVLELRVRNEAGRRRLDSWLGDYEWSVCYNHHSPNEPDVAKACWGDNFARLEEIKARYDPDHRFNVYHGVDYRPKEASELGCKPRRIPGLTSGSFFYMQFMPRLLLDQLLKVVAFFGRLF